jgi:acetyl-CoA carboxylase biotin carboxylase subunit
MLMQYIQDTDFFLKIQNFQKYLSGTRIKFIGASPEMIDRMGDKASAKSTMIETRCSMCSWFSNLESFEQTQEIAKSFGYPVMLKATAGGGEKECVQFGKKKIY